MLNKETVHLLFSKLGVVKNMDINSESFLMSSNSAQQKSSFMKEGCKRKGYQHESQFLNETIKTRITHGSQEKKNST